MRVLNKFFNRFNLRKQLNKVAEEFKEVSVQESVSTAYTHPASQPGSPMILSGGGAVQPSRGGNIQFGPLSANPSNAGANLGNHQHFVPNANNSMNIGIDLGLEDAYKPKRTKAISENRSKEFCDMLDRKIATLILARLKCLNEADRQALTLSIETLEMTRELVKEVFIHQAKE